MRFVPACTRQRFRAFFELFLDPAAHNPLSSAVGSLVIVGVYIILTILIWGLFAFGRGMWHDEIMVLYLILEKSGGLLTKLFVPVGSPTRILHATPFALAQWSGNPIFLMQILYGLTWFSTGMLSHLLSLRLFPQRTWLAYIVGSLTLCATSDFTTNALLALAIAISVAFYFASLVCLLTWWQQRSRKWLLATGICLYFSIWMYDAALPSIILTPLLLWVFDGFRFTKRLLKLLIFWYGLLTPYLIVFSNFLLDYNSYAQRALVPITLTERFQNTLVLFLNNFTPWVWAIGRRQWFPALPPVLPARLRVLFTLAGTIVFLVVAAWLWHKNSEVTSRPPREERLRFIHVALICLLMALLSNAIYSSVHFSQFFFRTHWVSRVWASLGMSLFLYGLGFLARTRLYTMLILPTIFVGFGIYGGLERQDYYLGYWRQHRAELRSIVEEVPGLRQDARLILYIPPKAPYYLATQATYLAQSWIAYLYGDPSLAKRVFLWSEDRNTYCIAESHAFVCQGEDSQLPGNDGHSPIFLKYSRTVLLIYSPAQNRYVLQDSIPTALMRNSAIKPYDYNPRAQIVTRPLPWYAYSLLYESHYIDTLFPSLYSPTFDLKEISLTEDPKSGTIDLFGSSKLRIGEPISATRWAMNLLTGGAAKEVIMVTEGKLLGRTIVDEYRPDTSD